MRTSLGNLPQRQLDPASYLLLHLAAPWGLAGLGVSCATEDRHGVARASRTSSMVGTGVLMKSACPPAWQGGPSCIQSVLSPGVWVHGLIYLSISHLSFLFTLPTNNIAIFFSLLKPASLHLFQWINHSLLWFTQWSKKNLSSSTAPTTL